MSELLADLTSHHIEGITREGSIFFSCPLFTEVGKNLWMGGCPRGDAPQFDTIFDLYGGEYYDVRPHQVRVTCSMLDSPDVPPQELIERIALMVLSAAHDGPTLVHCQAGLNRSGLITAVALKGRGHTDPIGHLREARSPAVLCNKAFEAFLREHYYPVATPA